MNKTNHQNKMRKISLIQREFLHFAVTKLADLLQFTLQNAKHSMRECCQ